MPSPASTARKITKVKAFQLATGHTNQQQHIAFACRLAKAGKFSLDLHAITGILIPDDDKNRIRQLPASQALDQTFLQILLPLKNETTIKYI